jgi:hypothetical protein
MLSIQIRVTTAQYESAVQLTATIGVEPSSPRWTDHQSDILTAVTAEFSVYLIDALILTADCSVVWCGHTDFNYWFLRLKKSSQGYDGSTGDAYIS